MRFDLQRRLFAEVLGTALLLAVVIGSGDREDPFNRSTGNWLYTIRDRDTTEQRRVPIAELPKILEADLRGHARIARGAQFLRQRDVEGVAHDRVAVAVEAFDVVGDVLAHPLTVPDGTSPGYGRAPMTPEQITSEWLSSVLGADVTITGDRRAVGSGVGSPWSGKGRGATTISVVAP